MVEDGIADEGPNPWAADRQSALALLELEIALKNNSRRWSKETDYEVIRSETPVTLPTEVLRLIGDCAWATDQTSAFVEIDNALKQAADEPEVTLPYEVASRIWRDISGSGKGRYKGQGRRRPSDSHSEKIRKEAVAAFGLQRKEFHSAGMKKTGEGNHISKAGRSSIYKISRAGEGYRQLLRRGRSERRVRRRRKGNAICISRSKKRSVHHQWQR